MRTGWQLELSAAAETDLRQILRWTSVRFGEAQARRYGQILQDALAALSEGPSAPGVRTREELGRGYMSIHTARRRRRARHMILFRILEEAEQSRIYVVRVLHEAMDIASHLSDGTEQ